MNLLVRPPVKPMLAKPVSSIPEGMFYEPKFDGFRCIVFADHNEVELTSRNTRPLTRYFPEVVAEIARQMPDKVVLDGELVVARGSALDFGALQERIHPADSRVKRLARETPASFMAFDLLASGDESWVDRPFSERRAELERVFASIEPPLHLTPSTTSIEVAGEWFNQFEGAGLDGIIAKPPGIRYAQDKRLMFKIKHERTADCVVAGYRIHKSGGVVGSLLLGLYDDRGRLHHVGVAAAFSMGQRKQLLDELAPHRLGPGETHPWTEGGEFERIPGGAPSRWNAGKNTEWEPLRPELVLEVGYDHMEGDRFRHVTQFKRWRPDRDPATSTFEQLERPLAFELNNVLNES